MNDLPERIASLSAAKRELLARRMRRAAAQSSEAITPRQDNAPVPLSPMQERLWLLEQIHGGQAAYNLSQAYRLRGPLNVRALENAFDALVARHESLRSTFRDVDGHALQIVGAPEALGLAIVPAESSEHAARLAGEEARRPFDLARGPLLRARLFRLNECDHVLMITMHHIISDGWSVAVLWKDVSRFYRAATAGESLPADELPVQYADFALWQRRRLGGEALASQLAYWRGQLQGAPTGIELPYDRTPPAVHGFRGGAWEEVWPEATSRGLAALAARVGATPFMAHLAVFVILLRRYSGQSDLLVGSPIAARTAVETEPMIGFFVNTLALRIDAGGEPTFLELLERVRRITLAGCENQDVPFDMLVADLKPDRSRLHMPLVQTMFGYQPARREFLDLPGVTIEPAPAETGTSKFDLTAELLDRPEGLRVRLEFNADVFDRTTIERIGRHYRCLLESVVADPHRSILRLPMLEESERRRILTEWNPPPTEYLKAPSVHALVESWAKRTGDAPAVVDGNRCLTYAQLNARANRLARGLRELGVGRESIVGVCLERSSELVVAMLAVLKAGGAYAPLDGQYPPARLAGLLAQTGAAAVVTQSSLRASLPAEAPNVVCLDADGAGLPADESDLAPVAGPDDLAYVIFTSGSTGAPKGVAVTHRAILRLVVGADYAPLMPDDVVAQAANAAFDAATFEIWAPLATGASLAVVPNETLLSPRDLGEEIRRRGITTLFVTTALFNRIAEECPQAFASLRRLLFGGEACDPLAVARVLREGRPGRLVHVYGPTETTTFATWHEVTVVPEGASTIPVGRPIANTSAFVLDEHLAPVPVGVRGQLCIGGPGLARGYLNDRALTAERFVPDPRGAEGERLYKTGDLARYCPDGVIELIGRLDRQVKIRGFRVEPGEVESALRAAGAREAVVLAKEYASGDRRLAAYVVVDPPLTCDDLRSRVAEALPAYMMPSAFVAMERLPLSPNGKVDRQALPAPEMSTPPAREYRAPRNALERELAAIWQDVLGVERVGIDESFFDDLGGHSLLAVRMFARIEKQLGCSLPIAVLFEAQTIEALAGELADRGRSRQARPVATLCREGAGGPFFCAAPMDAFAFLDLARALGPVRPFHVLHPLAAVDPIAPVLDIEGLADQYVAHVRAIQPQGPYLLGGYSVGGVVAFEAACRLRRQGQLVAALVLFDTWCPQRGLARVVNRLIRWRAIRYARTFLHLPPRDRLTYLADAFRSPAQRKLPAATGRADAAAEDPVARYWRGFHAAYKAAYAQYDPAPFDGHIVQFLCSKEPMELIDPRLLWRGLARGGLTVHRLGGDHRVFLQAPNVQAVAQLLQPLLAAADAGPQ